MLYILMLELHDIAKNINKKKKLTNKYCSEFAYL